MARMELRAPIMLPRYTHIMLWALSRYGGGGRKNKTTSSENGTVVLQGRVK
jgi:hypothetical protein